MPKYTYKCSDCDNLFTYHHSISERKTDCENCKIVDSLTRQPSAFFVSGLMEKEEKVGDVVKRSISELKNDLDKDKEVLKNNTWSPND